jgi:hypothetical protein
MGTMAVFMAMYLIPSGRGMHASLSGRMLLGSAQPLVLVLMTILLGGGSGGAWRGGSRCPAFDISGGGGPEGSCRDDDEEGPLREGLAPDADCPRLSSRYVQCDSSVAWRRLCAWSSS